jgi:hypothetical protein
MLIIFVDGVIGLLGVSVHVTQQDRELEPANRPGAGIIVRSEPIHLWLPQVLAELAQRQCQSTVVRSHEDLQRVLDIEDRKGLWYALTTRGHRVNGDFVDITVIRRPYDDPIHFSEMLDVLATVAGTALRNRDADYSTASVDILANELLKREPREIMTELPRRSGPDFGSGAQTVTFKILAIDPVTKRLYEIQRRGFPHAIDPPARIKRHRPFGLRFSHRAPLLKNSRNHFRPDRHKSPRSSRSLDQTCRPCRGSR